MGAISNPAGDVGFRRVVTFIASGVYEKPPGLRRVKVTVVAGGGAGGGASGSGYGRPGAAGGSTIKTIDAEDLSDTVAVTVPAPAVGGTAHGATGGVASFGAHCSATGGEGGDPASAVNKAAIPGVGVGGDINITGGGVDGASFSEGGDSILGGGASPRIPSTGGGIAGAIGGGGSGAYGTGSGGNGGAGLVIIEEYH